MAGVPARGREIDGDHGGDHYGNVDACVRDYRYV